MTQFIDSIDKIITTYFRGVTKESFDYRGKVFDPHPLMIRPSLLAPIHCVPDCGGCCPRFSLDYLPDEAHPKDVNPRTVFFNGGEYEVFSIRQDEHKDHHCKFLAKDDHGKCKIHPTRPFSCDFELIRFFMSSTVAKPNVIRQAPYGRGWNLLRIDGARGAMCVPGHRTKESIVETIRKLERLEDWCNYFGLENRCSDIIKWAKTPFFYNKPLLLQ